MKLSNVSKQYPKRGFALKDVTFQLGKGEFAFLTGHSGSGKSTTMRLIHMVDRPTAGEVRVSGYSSDKVTERDLWKVRRRVGYVFQDFRLLPGRTAYENVAFALEVTGTPPKAIKPKAQRLLSQVGLSTKAGAFVNELSGGEQQRVAIARALVNDPFVLLADEPTGNLDERATRGIMELFWDIQAKGMAVLMATHDLELIRQYPRTRVLELDHGKLVYDSRSPDDGVSRPDPPGPPPPESTGQEGGSSATQGGL
ncbi:MAG: cell division ATP-binding protein FtsE [Gemmatimonadetes bacterium]|nr:cell division ATP-binding protein FtsE [Gemmatimonadota bacterium]NNL30880.1 cell division ATP-binding protein FtsE [Gemmatimonadota bacterium]